MKLFLSSRIYGVFLMLICTCSLGQSIEKNNAQKLNISAASFKPHRVSSEITSVVSELNGCYSNVNYSEVNLPVGAFVTAIEPRIFVVSDEIDSLEVTFFVSSFPVVSALVGQEILVNVGHNSQLIQLKNAHEIGNQDVLWLNFPNLFSEQVMLCGVVVHYYPAGELIFRNGFD